MNIAPKTAAAAAGSSTATQLSVCIIWVLHQFFKIEIPPEVAVAFSGLLIIPITTVAAYLAPRSHEPQLADVAS